MGGINWDLAPEGATALKLDMHNNIYWVDDKNMPWVGTGWDNSSHHSSWKTIATRPQERKTIQDVLEAFPDGWPISLPSPDIEGWWFHGDGSLVWSYEFGGLKKHQKVCTREEYEKARAEKAGEWTHMHDGYRCKISIDKADSTGYIVVEREDVGYTLCTLRELEPIKPQISKANAWDMFMSGYAAEHIKETYDVVDESIEVQS